MGGKGAVYVVKGATWSTTPTVLPLTDARVVTIAGGASNVRFGEQVAFVGDMDKDGTPEFAASDPDITSKAGAVYVFNFKTAAPTSPSSAVLTITNDDPNAANDRFGISLAAGDMVGANGGDLDKDGYADLLVGAQAQGTGGGAVYQFNGSATLGTTTTSAATYVFVAPTGAVNFGATVVMGTDFNRNNGTGYNDLAIGDPLYVDNGQSIGRISYFY